MNTLNELYEMPPKEIDHHFTVLTGHGYSYLPDSFDPYGWEVYEDPNKKVEIRYIKNHCYDGRRVWILATVWFEGIPVMAIQNAGREGDDFSRMFVTNEDQYCNMVNYLKQFQTGEGDYPLPIYDPNEVRSDLTNFYNQGLQDEFEYHF